MHSDEVLQGLARSGLADVDALASTFVSAVQAVAPYGEGAVPEEILKADAEGSFELLLRLIAGLPVPERLQDLCERIGRNRARAGLPLAVLLRAIRIDFTILWEALVHLAEPKQYPDLVLSAGRVWNALEEYTVGIQHAYLDEIAMLARERDQERSALVAGFLSTNKGHPFLGQVATVLGMDVDAPFLVAAAGVRSENAMRRTAEKLRVRHVPVHVHNGGHQVLLIAQLPAGTTRVPRDWVGKVACGIGPLADGLTQVPQVARMCGQIVDVLPPDGSQPISLAECWPQIAARRMVDLVPALCAAVLPDARSISEAERARLLDTVRTYLDSGSVALTASRMYCHRNTVVNRLNRFGDLTGYDVTVPNHAAAVSVALASEGS